MKKIVALIVLFVALLPITVAGSIVTRGVTLTSNEGALVFNVTMPAFTISTLDKGYSRIEMENTGYTAYAGYPRLPMPTYTFVLPPGSVVKDVEITGYRSQIDGKYLLEASLPDMPLGASGEYVEKLFKDYEVTRDLVYSGKQALSDLLGETYSKYEQREYSLVTVACYPFAYDPVSGNLSVAKNISIRISYQPADKEHQEFVSRLIEAGSLESDIPRGLYNQAQVQEWYKSQERLLAKPKMLILTTAALKDSTSRYSYWRKSTGFDVEVVTKEEIVAASEGADVPQKIRNWLRENATDCNYLLIVGHFTDIPMRILSPYINGYTPDADVAPMPSDCYYGDLTAADNASWDSDKDGYYGEMLSAGGFPNPQDAPDFGMELHVGRINNSNPSTVAKILQKTWLFENSTNSTYKQTSVLAGGILWYPNWNGSGASGFDAAYYMEYLMNNGIVKAASAKTLYEEDGRMPSAYTPDVPLTQDNLKSTLKNTDAGVFVENNHGWKNSFARCVWATDDGDNVPEDAEFDWPNGLVSSDAFTLNTTNPNVAFLLSCLNGYAEESNCLAQALLNYGSVAVVAHTRSALGRQGWTNPSQGGQNGLYYYVLENYLKKSETYDYVLGDAVDAGRLNYYNLESGTSRYINTYEHIIFGDPAIRHMGRSGTLPPLQAVSENVTPLIPVSLTVDRNNRILFSLPTAMNVSVEVWDAAGRRVQTLYQGTAKAGDEVLSWDKSELPRGSYFITLKAENLVRTVKAVVIN